MEINLALQDMPIVYTTAISPPQRWGLIQLETRRLLFYGYYNRVLSVGRFRQLRIFGMSNWEYQDEETELSNALITQVLINRMNE